MKKLFFITAILCAVFCSSCSKEYDDSALWNDLNSLEARVAKLEELCKQMNTNISSLQTIVSALQNNDYVTGVTPITKNGEIIGYTITFKKSQPITIYHGEDGKDAQTPNIGVKNYVDDIYYWTLNGDWLLDENGNKIKAQGVDGEDGANGISPQIKIEDNYWYISYDNGKSWEKLGKATGEDGVNGTNGKDGDSMFTSIDTTSSDEYVIFTLSDGTQIKLPTWSAFEALRTRCNQMNTNIESLQALINVLQSHDYIKSVTPLMENGTQVGYTITFAYANAITIYSNATNPTAPIIGVKKDTDGIYYWTLNGEWLLNDAGNKIKAEGTDGSNGTNGSNGTDGTTPKLKIEEDYWYVSYDNGTSWTKLGKATGADGSNGLDGVNGEDGDNIFSSVTQDDEYVYFNLADGTIITLAKQDKENIQFEDLQVKAICCKKWDTNYDGELSYAEAAAVTDIGNTFFNTEIVAFNELKYFTSLTTLSGKAFSHCTKLWKIELPENITIIEDGETYDGEIRGTFANTAITNISIPNAVTSIGRYAFRFCTYLKRVQLGNKITVIGYEAFRKCISLSNIILPNSLVEIESNVFYDCETLTNITIPENVSTLGDPIIYSCENLRIVYCKPTTPPTLSDNQEPFGSPSSTTVGIIYVPKESVDVYKSKLGWKDYENKITGYDFE